MHWYYMCIYFQKSNIDHRKGAYYFVVFLWNLEGSVDQNRSQLLEVKKTHLLSKLSVNRPK